MRLKSLAAHTLCGLQHFLNVRRFFPGSWRLYAVWDRSEVPFRAPPLPRDIVRGIAGWLVAAGEVNAACLVLTGFNCFLRTGELQSLRRSHVQWSSSGASGVLILPWTKSGERSGAPETVTFSDPPVARFLRLACERVRPEDRLFTACGSRFRLLFDQALQALQVGGLGFRPYSLRRGGATADFIEHGSAATTQLRGRWASRRVARIYVTEGQEALARFLTPPTSLALVQHFALESACDLVSVLLERLADIQDWAAWIARIPLLCALTGARVVQVAPRLCALLALSIAVCVPPCCVAAFAQL